jgi:hypothetical protein
VEAAKARVAKQAAKEKVTAATAEKERAAKEAAKEATYLLRVPLGEYPGHPSYKPINTLRLGVRVAWNMRTSIV